MARSTIRVDSLRNSPKSELDVIFSISSGGSCLVGEASRFLTYSSPLLISPLNAVATLAFLIAPPRFSTEGSGNTSFSSSLIFSAVST